MPFAIDQAVVPIERQRRAMLLHFLVELDEDLERNQLLGEYLQALPRKSPRDRRWWTRQWVLRRRRHGHYDRLLVELREEDVPSYSNFLRMEPRMFNELLTRLAPRIRKKDTNWCRATRPGLKLALTL